MEHVEAVRDPGAQVHPPGSYLCCTTTIRDDNPETWKSPAIPTRLPRELGPVYPRTDLCSFLNPLERLLCAHTLVTLGLKSSGECGGYW